MKYIASLILISTSLLMACGNTQDQTQTHHHLNEAVDASNTATLIHEGVMVQNAVLRPPLPGRTTAMATMVLMNHTDVDDRLIEVKSKLNGDIEIHTMLKEEGVMKMRRLKNGITLPKGSIHTLENGGDHIMIFNTAIPAELKTVDLVLIFEHAGEINVQARIDDGSLSDDANDHDHSHH